MFNFSKTIFKRDLKKTRIFLLIYAIITVILMILIINIDKPSYYNQSSYIILINDKAEEYIKTNYTSESVLYITYDDYYQSDDIEFSEKFLKYVSEKYGEKSQVGDLRFRQTFREIYENSDVDNHILQSINILTLFATMIFVSILFFEERTQYTSSFTHSLPISRKSIYFTKLITAIVIPSIFVIISNISIYFLPSTLTIAFTIANIIYSIIGVILIVSLGMFSYSISGKYFAGLLTYILFMFLPIIIFMAISSYTDLDYSITSISLSPFILLYSPFSAPNQEYIIEKIVNNGSNVFLNDSFTIVEFYKFFPAETLHYIQLTICIAIIIIFTILSYVAYTKFNLKQLGNSYVFKSARITMKIISSTALALLISTFVKEIIMLSNGYTLIFFAILSVLNLYIIHRIDTLVSNN